MLFNSIQYLVFFATVALIYWIIPGKSRWMLLVIASLFFYAAHVPEYVAILIVSVIINYYIGIITGRTAELSKKRILLYSGVIFNLVMLAAFKYADDLYSLLFPAISKEVVASSLFPFTSKITDSVIPGIIMPLGISFFTFTNIAYLIDVKRGTTIPEEHAGYYMLFIIFFPKLLQGPIERANHFLVQIREPRTFSMNMAVNGMRLILWGFFKKLVIADRLGIAVDHVFDNPDAHTGPVLIFAAVLYSFQIYMDFSAYIDMARGAAKILGFDLLRNFNMPYLATSIKDFWDRWHMSLSSWLRDYVFLPVAFKTSKMLMKERYLGISTDQIIYAAAASITFLLAGFWHGTGWNYIIWGGLFAFYLILANVTAKAKKSFYKKTGLIRYKRINNVFQTLVTFSLVTFTWIFFRCDDTETAFRYIAGIPQGWNILFDSTLLLHRFTFPSFNLSDLVLVTISIVFAEVLEYHFYSGKMLHFFRNPPLIIRWGFYYLLLLILFVFGRFESDAFIYFQF